MVQNENLEFFKKEWLILGHCIRIPLTDVLHLFQISSINHFPKIHLTSKLFHFDHPICHFIEYM